MYEVYDDTRDLVIYTADTLDSANDKMLKREKEILFKFDWCGEYLEGLVKLVEES